MLPVAIAFFGPCFRRSEIFGAGWAVGEILCNFAGQLVNYLFPIILISS